MKKILILLMCTCSLNARAGSWPEWRGPGGQGLGSATGLPTEWSEDKNVTWKTTLPGRGYSSPVIEGNQVWMTTAFETKTSPEEAKERLKKNTGSQPLVLLDELKLHALCVDAKSGAILHNIELLRLEDPQWIHAENSYASPTPVLKDGRLYCHFGSYGNACLDTRTAKVLWTNSDFEVMHENGPGSSPVVHGNRMMLHMDGSDAQYVVALDTETGKEAWKTPRSGKMHDNPQLKKAYATPLMVKIDEKDVLVSPGANWLYGYDPENGKELWKVEYGVLGFSNVARPVSGNGMIYTVTGFMKSQLLAIKTTGSASPEIAWKVTKGIPKMPSPLLVGEHVYVVADQGGIAMCLDAKSGDQVWKERLNGNYSASPIAADGKMYFLSKEGVTSVVKPGAEFAVLAKNELDGKHLSSPAIADGALFIRTDTALYRIEDK